MSDQSNTPNHEAPASWSTHYMDPSGFECQLNLTAANGSELLKRAAAALLALVNSGCTPAIIKPTSNGNGKAQDQPAVTVCEFHNAEMKKHEKDGQVWYSHKLADGSYCKGKGVK